MGSFCRIVSTARLLTVHTCAYTNNTTTVHTSPHKICADPHLHHRTKAPRAPVAFRILQNPAATVTATSLLKTCSRGKTLSCTSCRHRCFGCLAHLKGGSI